MRSLKEIEAKIKDTTYDIDWAYSQQVVVPEEVDRRMGWLVGLGMAKALVDGFAKDIAISRIKVEIYGLDQKRGTPYEQGIKEALEFCLEGVKV